VLVAPRVPLTGERVDELQRQVQLSAIARGRAARQAEAGGRADLVRPAHGREDERITRRRHGGEMLALAQDDRADTDAAAFLECIAQERVRLYSPRTRGRQTVRVIEVEVVDRVGGE